MMSKSIFQTLSNSIWPQCKRYVSTLPHLSKSSRLVCPLMETNSNDLSPKTSSSRISSHGICTSASLRKEGIYSIEEKKTFIRVLNTEEQSPLMVDTISRVGFRLNNGMFAHGPIALFSRSVLSWRVQKAEDITPESLALFHMLSPKIDVLVIGYGDPGQKVPMETVMFMRSKRLYPEILPTEKAIAAFNFLNEEGRNVAAALIPPPSLNINASDYTQTLANRNELWIEKPVPEIDPRNEESYKPYLKTPER